MRSKGTKRYQECSEVGTGNELSAWGHTITETQASLFGGPSDWASLHFQEIGAGGGSQVGGQPRFRMASVPRVLS